MGPQPRRVAGKSASTRAKANTAAPPTSSAADADIDVDSPAPESPELHSMEDAATGEISLQAALSSAADIYSMIGLTSSARFFAHHAHTLAPSVDNALRLARIHAASGQHSHAVHLLTSSSSVPMSSPSPSTSFSAALGDTARLLAAQSLFALGQLNACLALLGDDDDGMLGETKISSLQKSDNGGMMTRLYAATCVLRARVHEKQDNAPRAISWYKCALRVDLFCHDAFDRIVNAYLIPPDESRSFILDVTASFLSETSNCSSAQSSGNVCESARASIWLAGFYRAAVDPSAPLPEAPPSIFSSLDVRHLQAKRAFDCRDFSKCISLIELIMQDCPHLPHSVLVTYLAALVEQKNCQQLFITAHQLVDREPKSGISWLAVGYYYFASGKPNLARRFFRKATTMDTRLAPAWVASGHACAAQDESDQAMAAYRTAGRLFPGAQLPPLFMGMEYARQGSLAHAALLFQSALRASQSDPAPRHELGVVAYKMGDMPRAAGYFKEALSLWEGADCGISQGMRSVKGRRADAEEATLVNLGHCYRRMGQYCRAKRCYEQALALRPRAPATCTALGMTLHALGNLSTAVVMYHRALRDSPGDAICNELLERALWDMFNGPNSSSNVGDDLTVIPGKSDVAP